ncbi:DNA-directed DNA/RNA polymerase mu [Hypsizygus marmoreus]|uniref:DNA-directed DNA/RNA polymerase mu n=1 Tax=Hypsizygus marmoreus TaxID=39966 RepID=A0A369K375_HYPMA|nr:DNA-directed DNA/RNA polymerase mu [Hypsizygus marmoreus]
MTPRATSVQRASSASSTLSTGSNSEERPIRVHVLQAKIDSGTIDELYALIDSETGRFLQLELCADPSDADIVITNVRMRKRLERHMDWTLARQKAIVTPEWLRDSIQQKRFLACGDYAALSELREETAANCPDCKMQLTSCHCVSSSSTNVKSSADPATHLITSTKVLSNYAARYACQRASPLVCPNQTLCAELNILRLHRELEGKAINALGYERAIAILKAYPYVITPENFESEVARLPYLGEKIRSKINEFIKFGFVEESQTIRMSERFQSLNLFTTIYGIGPSKARDLYSIGIRTIEDMLRYFDVPLGPDGRPIAEEQIILTPNKRRVPPKTRLPDISIKAALALREDLEKKIPRSEVEEMHSVVMAELEQLHPGCMSTIVGGYRRGKLDSNDVDIVISSFSQNSGGDHIKGLCGKLVRKLYDRGLVTNVMHLSGFHAHNALKTTHWDSLEKALTVFVLPPVDGKARIRRRLDLIFASPEAYWTAVVGWTGSRMFERDLRLWAKVEKGMKFDSSGMTRRHDSKLFVPKSEKDVFDMLDLEWIDPTLRNANL